MRGLRLVAQRISAPNRSLRPLSPQGQGPFSQSVCPSAQDPAFGPCVADSSSPCPPSVHAYHASQLMVLELTWDSCWRSVGRISSPMLLTPNSKVQHPSPGAGVVWPPTERPRRVSGLLLS